MIQRQKESKQLQVRANLRQADLAVAINVSPATLRKSEHRDIEPSMTREQWKKFSDVIGMPFDELSIAVIHRV